MRIDASAAPCSRCGHGPPFHAALCGVTEQLEERVAALDAVAKAAAELLCVIGDVLEEAMERDASGSAGPVRVSRETLGHLLEARARMRESLAGVSP